jgi:hypothetical protein
LPAGLPAVNTVRFLPPIIAFSGAMLQTSGAAEMQRNFTDTLREPDAFWAKPCYMDASRNVPAQGNMQT